MKKTNYQFIFTVISFVYYFKITLSHSLMKQISLIKLFPVKLCKQKILI